MCHSTCASCSSGQNTYTDCSSCSTSRYLFSNSCLCPKGQDTDSNYNCSDFTSSVSNLQDFVYALQYGLLSLMIISLFIKRHIPLTRKLLDTCQTIGLLFYIHQYYNPRTTVAFQLFQMTNLSTLIPNYIGNHFYGQSMQPNSNNSYKYLNMASEYQTPDYKFLINGKSSNFLINQLQVFVIWAVGLILFLIVGVGISIINQGKGFYEYIRFNIMNYVYIIFYFTFQESFLHLFLQLKNLQWTQVIHYISLGTMILYFILALFIIRSILISQNSYPKEQLQKKIEIFRRRDQCHFLFAFEDPLTDITIQEKSEKSALSPTEIVTSSWIVLSLIQKGIMTAVIVFQYDNKVEISLIVIIVIFFKLFFLIRPIKNKLILVFSFLADCYVIVIIVLSGESFLVYLLWPGILVLNFLMILEDVFSSRIYPTIHEVNYLEKIRHMYENEDQIGKNQQLNKRYNQELVVQNIGQNEFSQNQSTPNYLNQNIQPQTNQLDASNQIPLKNSIQRDQSLLVKQDTSIMNQNQGIDQSLNQSRIETQQQLNKGATQNNIPEVINIQQNKNNHAAINGQQVAGNSINPLGMSQSKVKNNSMVDMKQKYLERIRKQNENLLQKQPTQPELEKSAKIQKMDSINEQQKKENQAQFQGFYGPENYQQKQNISKNSKNQLSDVALKDSQRKIDNNDNNLNSQKNDNSYNVDKDSFFDTQEDYENYQNNPQGQQEYQGANEQLNKNKDMQINQRQNSYNQQQQQQIQQKKIDEELASQWKFD